MTQAPRVSSGSLSRLRVLYSNPARKKIVLKNKFGPDNGCRCFFLVVMVVRNVCSHTITATTDSYYRAKQVSDRMR